MQAFLVFLLSGCLILSLLVPSSLGFQSDELLVDDDEFGLGGGRSPEPVPSRSQSSTTLPSTRRRSSDFSGAGASDSYSKVQFSLEHAFGDSDFSPAGSFSARLKTSNQVTQTLTKLRFSRNAFSDAEKEKFEKLLQDDEFYRIRLPSSVATPPGREYIISSVKARCLPREALDEHFFIHMDGVNILAVNYGSPGACQYPRQSKLPGKWTFNSHTILKNTDQAPRAPIFAEDMLGGEEVEGEGVKPVEKSFWAKYVGIQRSGYFLKGWMYLIPLGLIVMNAITQALNMPEEQATGQPGSQGPAAAAVQRGPSPAVRRR